MSIVRGKGKRQLGEFEWIKITKSVLLAGIVTLLAVMATAGLDHLSETVLPMLKESKTWWITLLYPAIAVALNTLRQWLKDNTGETR